MFFSWIFMFLGLRRVHVVRVRQVSNPVILVDEVDKLGRDFRLLTIALRLHVAEVGIHLQHYWRCSTRSRTPTSETFTWCGSGLEGMPWCQGCALRPFEGALHLHRQRHGHDPRATARPRLDFRDPRVGSGQEWRSFALRAMSTRRSWPLRTSISSRRPSKPARTLG